ncbi:MAG: aldehyde ferredoxin oxidoreductase [Candidatus Heimdallarchaeota archaeon]|nr:aldehyde ferredoxin oxidoreductase [Candidatus Heimdallarchaeota archaeon]MDH5647742.1 aldehyde ferredoxin oxidoreductase [Candidatus Heimdallarchaeota archaeon]
MLESEKKILRVDMKNLTVKWEDTPDKYKLLAGRGLTSAIIASEVPGLADAIGPKNKLVVAPGMVTGSTAPTSGRISVGGKSPLTNGIKEANAGGRTPHKLARAGVRALVVENQPSDRDAWYNILIRKGDAEIVQANEFRSMGAYDLIKKVYEKYDTKPGIIGAGVAGQNLLKGAGIFGNNVENTDPGRYAGRGGLGAVLGSKNVIAIITDDSPGEPIQPVDRDKFKDGTRRLSEALRSHPVTGDDGGLQNYGTNILMNIINEAGALPTRNWQTGQFEDAAKISGEAHHERVDQVIELTAGNTDACYAHACNPGCIIKCSNAVPFNNNTNMVSAFEYETSWALGANCGIGNIDDVAELNRMCNDYGLDTIETGNAIGVAMQAGVIAFGDAEGAKKLMREIAENTPNGRIVGNGAVTVGNVYGITRVAHVKGQSLPAYDPRPIKGIGVTYATNPMGGDHTAGYTIAAEILGIKGTVTDPRAMDKAELSRVFQETTAFLDSSGYCLFTAFSILDIDDGFDGLVQSVAGMLGTEYTLADVGPLGRTILDMEINFNRSAGLSRAHDRLPEFMDSEPLAPHNVVFGVTDEELDKVHPHIP